MARTGNNYPVVGDAAPLVTVAIAVRLPQRYAEWTVRRGEISRVLEGNLEPALGRAVLLTQHFCMPRPKDASFRSESGGWTLPAPAMPIYGGRDGCAVEVTVFQSIYKIYYVLSWGGSARVQPGAFVYFGWA